MPTPPPNSRADWRKWLEENPFRTEDVWFISYKKASAKRAILEWISNAKRSETSDKRIDETVLKVEENIRANPWRP